MAHRLAKMNLLRLVWNAVGNTPESENPYASPKTEIAKAEDAEVLLELKPSLLRKVFFVLFSLPYLGGAFYFVKLALTDAFAWAPLMPVVSAISLAFTASIFLFVLFDRQTYTHEGVRLSKMSFKLTSWGDIDSWRTKNNGAIQIVLSRGGKRYLNHLGPKSYNLQIIEILKQKVGPESVQE